MVMRQAPAKKSPMKNSRRVKDRRTGQGQGPENVPSPASVTLLIQLELRRRPGSRLCRCSLIRFSPVRRFPVGKN